MTTTAKLTILSLLLLPAALAWAQEGKKDYDKECDVYTDVVYGHKYALAMTMDIVQPKKGNGAGIAWIVSGAWHSGVFPPQAAFSDSYPYSAFFDCRALLDKGFTVFFVRHGDGSKFHMPEIVDDVRQSIRFIRLTGRKYGVDPERIGAIGGSAGGHLVMMLATTSDEGVPNPKNWEGLLMTSDRLNAAVAYYPPTDVREWWKNGNVTHYEEAFKFDPKLGGDYSPLLWASPYSAPSLMVCGDKDAYWNSDDQMREALKKDNVPCQLLTIPGVGHGFDIGFKGFKDYTPAQMKILELTRKTSVDWFQKMLLGPRKEKKAPVTTAPEAAAKAKLTGEYAVVDLSKGPAGPWPVTELDKAPEDLLKNDAWRTTKLLLRRIPAGKFVMGSPQNDPIAQTYTREYHAQDKPHTVTLTKAFYMAVFPTTQEQWSHVMGNEPSYFAGNPQRPVERVSWTEIRGGTWPGQADEKSFVGRFSKGTSQAFDLPTEAQWEYACLAGTTRALNDPSANKGEGADCTDANMDKIGWFEGNSQRQTHDVGLKAPNAWGLYDMCGNVSQWCLDLYGEYPGDVTDPVGNDKNRGSRVTRGGYWSMPAAGCRSSARNYDAGPPQDREKVGYDVCGFRLVLPAGD